MNKKKLLPQKMHSKFWVVFKIAPSKNTFQSIGDFLKLLPQKIHFRTSVIFQNCSLKMYFSKLLLKICIINKIVFLNYDLIVYMLLNSYIYVILEKLTETKI